MLQYILLYTYLEYVGEVLGEDIGGAMECL